MPDLSVRQAETQKEVADALKVRREVFIEGQRIPEEVELDGKDDGAEHIVAYIDNTPIGCARIRHVKGGAKIERMAVLDDYQGRGFGNAILNFTIALIKERYPKERIYLHAQKGVQEFYKKEGFVTKGKIFHEAGIPHVKMILEKKIIVNS